MGKLFTSVFSAESLMKLFFDPGQKKKMRYDAKKARDEKHKRMQRNSKTESDMIANMIVAMFLATGPG